MQFVSHVPHRIPSSANGFVHWGWMCAEQCVTDSERGVCHASMPEYAVELSQGRGVIGEESVPLDVYGHGRQLHLGSHGKPDFEGRTDTQRALDADVSTVRIDDFVGDGQSQASPFTTCITGAVEAAEQIIYFFGGDARALILDGNQTIIGRSTQFNAHSAAGFAVPYRIIYQVI